MRSHTPAIAGLLLLWQPACMTQPEYGDPLREAVAAEADVGCPAFSLELAQELGPEELVVQERLSRFASPTHNGPGLAVYDADGDGDLDVAVAVELSETLVFENPGDGSLGEVLERREPASALAAGDVDGDGRTDLFLARRNGLQDILDLADPTLPDVVLQDSEGLSTGGAFFDLHGDGDLDLAVSRHVDVTDHALIESGELVGGGNTVVEQEGMRFEPRPELLPEGLVGATSFQALVLDADSDGLSDLYWANDFGWWTHPNRLLMGDLEHGLVAAESTGAELEAATMGATAGDLDGDGVMDLWLSDAGRPDLLLGDGQGGFYEAGVALDASVPHDALHESSWGTELADLDLDGRPELLAAYGPFVVEDQRAGRRGEMSLGGIENPEGQELLDPQGQRDVLLHQLPDGHFEDLSAEAGFDSDDIGRSVMAVDLDGDGVLEVLLTGWLGRSAPFLRRFVVRGGCGEGLTVRLEGGAHHQGAIVEAWLGDEHILLQPTMGRAFSSAPLASTIALRGQERVDRVRLTLPDGSSQTWEDLGPGELIVPIELD